MNTSIRSLTLAAASVLGTAPCGVYSGKYQDNLTSGCTTPYSGGTDAGGNN